MKKMKIYFLMISMLVLCSGCITARFDGDRTGNESRLIMSYNVLTGSDSQILTLQAEDQLAVDIVSEKGSVSLEIKKNGSDAVYTGKDIPTGSFSVTVSESGDYTVTVTGKKAKGSVSVVKKEGVDE